MQADIEIALEVGSLSKTDHFAHRKTDGIVVDLFWNRGELAKEFRVEVEDRGEEAHLVLHPTTGTDAIDAVGGVRPPRSWRCSLRRVMPPCHIAWVSTVIAVRT